MSGLSSPTPSLILEELVRLDHPEGDEPERCADGMWEIHEDLGLRVLGGCCGTDHRHIEQIAEACAPLFPVAS